MLVGWTGCVVKYGCLCVSNFNNSICVGMGYLSLQPRHATSFTYLVLGSVGLGLVVLGRGRGDLLLLTLVLGVLRHDGGVGSGVLDHVALGIHHAGVVRGDADTSSRVHTAEVELPTGLAERAGVAEVAADQGHAAVLAELELVGHLAADACGEAAGEAVGNNAHAAAAGVGLAGDGVALAAHLAAGAPVGIAALCHVGEASANGVVETGHRLFVV